MAGWRTTRVGLVLLLAFLFLSQPAWGQKHRDVENIGHRDITKGSLNLYSLEREIELGRSLAARIESNSGLLRDARVEGYVNDLVQRLVRSSDAKVPFTVRVIDSDELNVYALPGGFFYVNTGLILEAETEAELAGLFAHEIAHVTARHTTRQLSRGELFQWLSLPLFFVGGGVAAGVYQALNVVVPLSYFKFRRDMEREADFLGLQYAYHAGYDPTALIDILERMKEKQRQERVPLVFSTHPMTKDRVERARREISEVLPSRGDHVVTSSEFQKVKAHLKDVLQVYGDEEQGTRHGPRLRRRTQDGDGGEP